MTWAVWARRWLPVAGLAVTVLALLDPLEGFPFVLIGGVLTLMAAIQEHSRYAKLVGGGLAAAAIGCALMVALSWAGGAGGASGRSIWWLAILAPYPLGVVAFLVGGVLVLRTRSVVERR